ncbi:hypothetical protein DICSQDRAFT_181403 [Dichomitus squalens LYAD-421 SS1]|uniref:BTB domain-containing protein n=1 Tax=Dichomitus squalens (strain LYAD-421) TaxID=732165 RepID=R7SZ61_DICSQ|nr:uncharacterized protein DICSQDRAFT_181403 [Dichomitus squalens LYAD-421 SS1]EJF60247.1 hypothetical protein DICSQDRAFT_181403 [Dichomitus squalens LYAD-421 SS1]
MSSGVRRKRARMDEEDAAAVKAELQELEGSMDVDAASPPDPEAPRSDASGTRADVSASNVDEDAEAYVQDKNLWFHDGTAILVAAGVGFRIYKGLLAEHSPVFKELFSQDHPLRTLPIDETQTITCPLIQLSDSAHDLRYILRVYMPRRNASVYGPCIPSFDKLSASIRLGQKYQITPLYEQSIRLLKNYYTDDLSVWLRANKRPPGFSAVNVIGVVNLARLTGELSILPAALYRCTLLDSRIVRGYKRADGSQENLTLDDLGLVFDAKTEIRKAGVAVMLRAFNGGLANGCTRSNTCSAALHDAMAGLDEHVDQLIAGGAFQNYTVVLKDKKLAVCTACKEAVNLRHSKERQSMWDRLPELLRIQVPGWGAEKPLP